MDPTTKDELMKLHSNCEFSKWYRQSKNDKFELCKVFCNLSKKYQIDYSKFSKMNFEELFAMQKYKLVGKLSCHLKMVTCIFVYDGKLYSGGNDNAIWVHDCETHNCIDILCDDIGKGTVTCLTAYDGKLFSGYEDKTIKVWDCNEHKLIIILESESILVKPKYLLVYCGKLYSLYHDGVIRVWNCDDFTFNTTLDINNASEENDEINHGMVGLFDDDENDISMLSFNREITCFTIEDGILYSGNRRGRIKIWDCEKNILIKTIVVSLEVIISITTANQKLYCGTSNEISVYDCSANYVPIISVGPISSPHDYRDLTVHDGKLYCIYGESIMVRDCNDLGMIYTIHNGTHYTRNLCIHNNLIYSCSPFSSPGSIYMWKI